MKMLDIMKTFTNRLDINSSFVDNIKDIFFKSGNTYFTLSRMGNETAHMNNWTVKLQAFRGTLMKIMNSWESDDIYIYICILYGIC